MKQFLGEDFLLNTETAVQLYKNYASKLPIIDYHCHVNPKEIAEDRTYSNITELWLGGDHYKWRAIRSCGVNERYITGDASDYEKFKAFAEIMPKLIGNPLYHWSHLELKEYFGYTGTLNSSTCDEVWELCNQKLSSPEMSVKNIIRKSNVELLCTTDDPIDSLEYHKIIAQDKDFPVKVLPAWRPDKALKLDFKGYKTYIDSLAQVSGVNITDLASLKEALVKRLDFFNASGCKTADHGIDNYVPFAPYVNEKQLDDIFQKAYRSDGGIPVDEADIFRTAMYCFLGKEYVKRKWIMQIHYGVLRNPNSKMLKRLGPDTGFDIIHGNVNSTANLAALLDSMFASDSLPRTVIYSINPNDNAAIGALIGAFQTDSEDNFPRVMQGSAWWFNDNNAGMKAQMISLANLSAFGNFLGMLTDSRSFISYTRHDYFRRILCNLIGEWVEGGEYPLDIDSLAETVMDICYNNTKNFFAF